MTIWTTTECEERLAALQAALDEVVVLPTSGSTGSSSLDLSGTPAQLRAEMVRWRARLVASRRGGLVRRQTRGC